MKKIIPFIVATLIVGATACNNDTAQNTTTKKIENDSPKKKGADSLGMKMGGNELDSKKK